MAECGRAMITGAPGTRDLRRAGYAIDWGLSLLLRRIAASFMWRAGKGCNVPISLSGTASTNPPDSGKTWQHLGLRDGQQIPALAVDPHDPNRLFAAVLGHPYGPNEERGIFRSVDGVARRGRKCFTKTRAPAWRLRCGDRPRATQRGLCRTVGVTPRTLGRWQFLCRHAWRPFQIYRWGRHLASVEQRVCLDELVQINVALAASVPNRLWMRRSPTTKQGEYGSGAGLGVYRSDDAGESWYKATDDPRPGMRIRRRRSTRASSRSERSRRCLQHEHPLPCGPPTAARPG